MRLRHLDQEQTNGMIGFLSLNARWTLSESLWCKTTWQLAWKRKTKYIHVAGAVNQQANIIIQCTRIDPRRMPSSGWGGEDHSNFQDLEIIPGKWDIFRNCNCRSNGHCCHETLEGRMHAIRSIANWSGFWRYSVTTMRLHHQSNPWWPTARIALGSCCKGGDEGTSMIVHHAWKSMIINGSKDIKAQLM